MRYLLFDADQTIWNFKATEEIGLRSIFSSIGISYDSTSLDSYMIGNLQCWKEYEDGMLSLDELETKRWNLFFKRIGRNDLSAEDAAKRFKFLLAHNGRLLDGAEDFLKSISDCPKSLVTNGISEIQRQRLKDTATDRFFEHIFISSEIGWHKPQKELFDEILSVLGKKREECVMIGDSEHSDIAGANNAGIDSIYINFEGKTSLQATWSVSSYRELRDLIRRI